ncbi:thioesterase family protein [Acinetobacter guerrae]|uniref:thioesterase family protein n=1 Tax=Acinetobacter guerrae TaxID=1843371 RepID=UPI00125EA4A2|nr:thioesterase family protein [Acinetobacter guerrae]
MPYLAELIKSINFNEPFTPPSNWFQGRTVYGGLSSALALQSIIAEIESEQNLRLRSAQIAFIGVMAENLEFKSKLLKQSKSSRWYQVDGFSNGELGLSVTFLFTQDRASQIAHDFSPSQQVKSPEHYQRLQHPLAPASLANLDLRPAGGSMPVSGSDHPELIAWIKHLDDDGVNPYVSLLALADGLPPAAMTTFSEFAPISSMNWNLDILRPIEQSEWHLIRSYSLFAEHGYSYQQMQLWDQNGNLILQGTQTVAIYL